MITLDPEDVENVVLGACGLSRSLSAWRSYQVAQGRLPAPDRDTSTLSATMAESLERHLENQLGAMLYRSQPWEMARGLLLPPVLQIGEPGGLPANPDDPIIIETPDQETYKFAWRDAESSGVPFRVRARANLRMAASGSAMALVWVVADMGRVDEFYTVPKEDRLIDRLLGGAEQLVANIDQGKEPDPEEDDAADVIAMLDGRTDNVREVKPGEPIIPMVDEYRRLVGSRLNLEREADALKTQEKRLKDGILLELRTSPRLRLPDGRLISAKVIRQKERLQKAGQWVRLDVENAA
jgi:hypothetical protein